MTSTNNSRRTPLFDYYQKNKIKLMDFGGWVMPIQFTGIIEEHKAVRNEAGLFDVSHMGEILVEGEDAEKYLDFLLTNDVTQMITGQSQYHAMCYPDGGTIDDLIISKLATNGYLVTSNAGNTEKDFDWMKEKVTGDVQLTNKSDSIGLLALQGPAAEEILQKLTEVDLSDIQAFHFNQQVTLAEIENVLISRTGYTGENGFELYLAANKTEKLWELLLAAGKEEGLKPCGLGSRDTLRLEAALSLYGHELSADISPLQANIGFAVKTNKAHDFVGKKDLKRQREVGVKQKIRGFELIGKGIARSGCKIYAKSGEEIGVVTSGTKSPTLNKSIGLALINTKKNDIDALVQIDIRNKLIDAVLVKTPFYKRETK
ncbi:glycine cleavage system aminomethyltransferase GcvT [Carnobacterium funditum]|uniref:glycine cleavage system aminomethyltransferase GcvT n=1 Tax=Carnobacterium funditum TaxID=2752 RepID=UPI00054FE689|nr:glycine cleavage system aminomethyltransferase GcvT [Carnobacterium funditum]